MNNKDLNMIQNTNLYRALVKRKSRLARIAAMQFAEGYPRADCRPALASITKEVRRDA